MTTIPPALRESARGFAETLNERVKRVLPDSQPEFLAQVLPGPRPSLSVAPVWSDDDNRQVQPLTLVCAGRHRDHKLTLRAMFWCCSDVSGKYLTIEKSEFHLGLADVPDPFFRYEYERNMRRSTHLPAAHVQIHAHRDETTWLMSHADEARPRIRWRRDRVPRLSEFHCPVGGDRYRPCLEDVLAIAINELGARSRQGAWQALEEGRAEWRRLQLKAAVRDAPALAAGVLRDEGWIVRKTKKATARERTHRLGEI